MKIGFIGVGNMASAIIAGLKQATDATIVISNSTMDKSQLKAKELDVDAANSHQDLIDQSDLVVIGVKPQVIDKVLSELVITKPVVSMVAGKSLAQLEHLTSPKTPIIRIMPNLNAQILKSTTAICCNTAVSPQCYDTVITLVNSFGTAFPIEERDFDAFTALAGSSPAYIAYIIDAMAKAGVKYGFSKETALAITTHTMLATAENLCLHHEKPSDFIDRVASPGGITIEGLVTLEKTGLSSSLISTIEATVEKSRELMVDETSKTYPLR